MSIIKSFNNKIRTNEDEEELENISNERSKNSCSNFDVSIGSSKCTVSNNDENLNISLRSYESGLSSKGDRSRNERVIINSNGHSNAYEPRLYNNKFK
jgi:hypothetical protein